MLNWWTFNLHCCCCCRMSRRDLPYECTVRRWHEISSPDVWWRAVDAKWPAFTYF